LYESENTGFAGKGICKNMKIKGLLGGQARRGICKVMKTKGRQI
jgi:hypothetical protein